MSAIKYRQKGLLIDMIDNMYIACNYNIFQIIIPWKEMAGRLHDDYDNNQYPPLCLAHNGTDGR